MTERRDSTAGESPVDLLGDVVSGFARLISGEFALARAEAKRSLGDAGSALGKLALATILAVVALNLLSGAAVAGLVALRLSPVLANLAVGVSFLLLALGLARLALAQLKPSNLAPKRMMANLRSDAETLKSMVISDATTPSQR